MLDVVLPKVWYFLFVDFESLCKAYVKAKKVVDKEGIPRFYIRNLVELEDFVTEVVDKGFISKENKH